MGPQARQECLITEELEGELIIDDLEREEIHRLSPIAATIWRHCDEHTSINQLVRLVRRGADADAGGDVVRLALEHLETSHLLDLPTDQVLTGTRQSRRQVVQNLGVVAGGGAPATRHLHRRADPVLRAVRPMYPAEPHRWPGRSDGSPRLPRHELRGRWEGRGISRV